MNRWLVWLLAGATLGGIVHLTSVLVLPATATQDAYSRLAPVTPVNTLAMLPAPSPEEPVLPFLDPAFAMAICRYDLSQAPLKLAAPVTPSYTSISFYSRKGIAYYAINDRAAGRRAIELQVMTPEQRAEIPDEEDVTSADRLIVESPTTTGIILLKAFGPEPGLLATARNALRTAQCRSEQAAAQ